MSEEKKTSKAAAPEKQKDDSSLPRLAGTLCAICAVCALLLGGANMLTEDRIYHNQNAKAFEAMAEVLPFAGDYEQVDYAGGETTVESVFKAEGTGYVFQVRPATSYSGTLAVMVGVNTDGTVSGIQIVESGETSGLGDNAKDPVWREQFVGKSGSVSIDKDGGEITAISGASFTSRGVCEAVTSALTAAAELG